ncbi:uncharacterized protein [Eleutherodactylus coqui]|uniref:uncharacterized protein n=1 Tax=Eleutherodactylus coqui TaxID=57060 RepID=UPI003462CF81
METVCVFCEALKWKDETPGMCCCSGKVQLPPFRDLPILLNSLFIEEHPESEHFLNSIRKYNSAFQMTSFGAKQVVEGNCMPTFKVQGQVYHLIGSLLPSPEYQHTFLQIYFVGDEEEQINIRCKNASVVNHNLIRQLQRMLHDCNPYIKDFKSAVESLPSDDKDQFQIVIHAERNPVNAHKGCFNKPTVNEVAVVIVGQTFEKRDIVLQATDSKLHRISEIHRSYDALQYPIMFCYGEDGYSISLPQVHPTTKQPLNKTISALNFYAYRLMIRQNKQNHIFHCRSLLSQFLVDMYAKIETERLNFIRNNQKTLRAESYIHLKDAIDKNDADIRQLGQAVILPSSFTGGPRYMHEHTQDAMTYVRHYGRPDLFITFTCNSKWTEITEALLPRQKPQHRHDITSRVFHLKIKKIVSLLTKGSLFGKPRCYMYSVEWQKRGLPRIHILLWLENAITPDRIDNIICAEISNPKEDPILYNIVKRNMIHGPCGNFNTHFQFIKDGKCSKRYPKPFLSETQTGDDGYPKYRRRSPSEGGFTVTIEKAQGTWVLDNSWVVPFNPVLLRTFNAHINVEYCNSVKSIKYICKYVDKGSEQATFAMENECDEINIYQTGRY